MNPNNLSSPQTTPAQSSSSAGGAIASAKPGLTATARDAATQLKSAATQTATRARDEAERMASEKKSTAAERIDSYSSAIHESARAFEEKDPNIAHFTHLAADRLHGIADYVRNRDFNDLRRDAEDLARRHPAVFFGGLFVAGLLLGNILKASSRRSPESSGIAASKDDSSDWATTSSGSSFPVYPETSPAAGL
jgi:hypothetical protein